MAPIREWYGGYTILYNWFEDRYGYEELQKYWKYIADEIYTELGEKFKEGGLLYIRDYFRDIIEEDEGSVEFKLSDDSLIVDIIECPDNKWQKFYDAGYSIGRENYYRSYEVIYSETAKKAGFEFKVLRYDPTGKLKFEFSK